MGGFGALFNALWGNQGDKPTVPDFPSSNDILGTTLDTNLGNFSRINDLASKYNQANLDQVMKRMSELNPDWQKQLDQGAKTITSWMKGEVPTDVTEQLMRLGADKSMAGGFGGSGMSRNLTARDLGLTSLDLMGKGMSGMESWTGMLHGLAPMFDFNKMFITPDMQLRISADQWQTQWLKNQVTAMPSPEDMAWNQFWTSAGNQLDYMLNSAWGRYMGGGAAQPPGDTQAQNWGQQYGNAMENNASQNQSFNDQLRQMGYMS